MLPIKGPGQEDDDEPAVPLRKAHGLQYLRRFLATKNSWKGKYARVFCVCEQSVLTLNPTTFEVTNEWSYAGDLLDVSCSGIDTTDFSITVKKSEGSTSSFMRKTTKISFSCEHRAALLTALLRAKEAALTAPPPPTADGVPVPPPPPPAAKSVAPTFPGSLQSGDSGVLPTPVALVVSPTSLDVRLVASGAILNTAAQVSADESSGAPPHCSFAYEDIEAVRAVRTTPASSIFALHHGGGRVALLVCERRRDLLLALTKAAALLGVGLAIGSELGVPATTQAAIISTAAKRAVAAAAAVGTADSSPL